MNLNNFNLNNTHIGYLALYEGPEQGWVKYPLTEADLQSEDQDTRNDVKNLLEGLVEPWSETSKHYNVHPSYTCGAENITEDERWLCDYTSIVYDGIEAHVIAFGATAEDAFINCKNRLQYLFDDIAPTFSVSIENTYDK